MDVSPGDSLIGQSDGETAVSIQHLGVGSAVVRDVVRSNRPTVITDEGIPVAAIVDAATYEALRLDRAARDLKRDLDKAIASADSGDLIEHDEVVRQIRERFVGRVPPSVLAELDEALEA